MSSPKAYGETSSAGWTQPRSPQNLPTCSRHQLMGTIPAPRPSPGRRGSWLLSGGCEGGERAGGGEAQAHRPGAGACQALNPEQSSQARGATGSPRTPFPPALPELHQSGCDAGAAGLPSERWLRVNIIPPAPRLAVCHGDPTASSSHPNFTSGRRLAAPIAPAPRCVCGWELGWDGGVTVRAAGLCHPGTAAGSRRRRQAAKAACNPPPKR